MLRSLCKCTSANQIKPENDRSATAEQAGSVRPIISKAFIFSGGEFQVHPLQNYAIFALRKKSEERSPGSRLSKASDTFRAREAIPSYLYIWNREEYKPETLYDGILEPQSWISIFFPKRQKTTLNYCKVLKLNKTVLKNRKKVRIIVLKLIFIDINTKITNLEKKHACQNTVAIVMSSFWHNNLSDQIVPR